MDDFESAHLPISKLEIVEGHLVTSIQMIALEMSPISTHVIVMACEEMILSLANAHNVFLDFDYRIYVQDEFHKKYRKQIRKPYNFFKHADSDPFDKYEGPDENDLSAVNEIVTLMNSIGYSTLGGKNRRDLTKTFAITMMMKTPRLFKTDWLNDLPELKRAYDEVKTKPQYANVALRESLYREGLLPEVPYRGAPLS